MISLEGTPLKWTVLCNFSRIGMLISLANWLTTFWPCPTSSGSTVQWKLAICYFRVEEPPTLPVAVMVTFDSYSGPSFSDGTVNKVGSTDSITSSDVILCGFMASLLICCLIQSWTSSFSVVHTLVIVDCSLFSCAGLLSNVHLFCQVPKLPKC